MSITHENQFHMSHVSPLLVLGFPQSVLPWDIKQTGKEKQKSAFI